MRVQRVHGRRMFAGAAAISAAMLVAPALAAASHGVTAPVSVNSAGVIGNDQSNYADMTPDGRFVSFASLASNLVPGDTNGVGDVFVRDRRTGQTERVSIGLKGAQGDDDSNILGIATNTAISDDGRFVAFKSTATNLVRGDRNGTTDVFVRDRLAGATERISVDSAEREAAGGGDAPAISPDGRFVAFVTRDFDSDFSDDVYLRDRVAGTTVRISVAFDGGDAQNNSGGPAVGLAPGGPLVAFSSAADNLVPDDGDGATDVFVRDLSGPAPVTKRISVSSDEEPQTFADGGFGFGSSAPAISGDGRFVAFQSDAVNFTAQDQTRNFTDVFVRDRQTGTTELASPNAAGGEANGQSQGADLSPDGRFVSFASFATDLVSPADPDFLLMDAFVRDRVAGSTELVSVASDHSDARFGAFDTHVGTGPVSADGLVSLMSTNADNLFPGDDNLNLDVYANDRRPGTDLSLAMDDVPDPVAARGSLSYTLDCHERRRRSRSRGGHPRHAARGRDVHERIARVYPRVRHRRLRARDAGARRERERDDRGDAEARGIVDEHGRRRQRGRRPRRLRQHRDHHDDGHEVARARSGDALARADLDRQPVGRRRERTRPARVVGARRVVREVEVEYEPVALAAEIGALDGVEHVPAAAVAGRAARRIGERDIDAAAVSLEPVELEREAAAIELERGDAEAREPVCAVVAGADVERQRLDREDGRERSRRRVVVEEGEPAEGGALVLWERRLRMAREQVVASGAPDPPRLDRIGSRAHLAVEVGDAPPPVREREQVTRPAGRGRRRGVGRSCHGRESSPRGVGRNGSFTEEQQKTGSLLIAP